MDSWDVSVTDITVRQGGKTPGCAIIFIFLLGAATLTVAALFYFSIIALPFDGDTLPILVFFTAFGLFWWFAAIRSRNATQQTTLTIDTFNRTVAFEAGGPVIHTPFADLEAAVIHETKTEVSETRSIHSRPSGTSQKRYTYSYRIYLQKRDGSLIWVWTFSRKDDARKHMQILLERIEITCIDEAGCGLARTKVNPYVFAGVRQVPSESSRYLEMQDGGTDTIVLRYSRFGFSAIFWALALFGLVLVSPVSAPIRQGGRSTGRSAKSGSSKPLRRRPVPPRARDRSGDIAPTHEQVRLQQRCGPHDPPVRGARWPQPHRAMVRYPRGSAR